MMRTKSPPSADSAPGASLASSTRRASSSATPAGPTPPAASISRAMRMALYTFPARASPSGPAASRRASHPESATMPCMMSASATFPTCSDARRIRLAHAASAGETAHPDATLRSIWRKPWSNARLRGMPRSSSMPVDSSSKSSADRANSSLESTSNSAVVHFGFATACARRTISATSGARLKMEPPATTHGSPSARSASAYTFARPMPPSSTTMSPGLCPAAANPENDFATRRAATAAASADDTPRDGVTVTCTCTRGPSGRNGRLTLDSARPGANDMNSAPNTCGCSKMRSHSASTSPWLRKLSGSSMMPSGLRRRTSSRWRRYTDTSAPRNR